MKSKAELLNLQNDKEEKKFQSYIKLMEEIIEKNYPNGLDFNECPYIKRFVYHRDIDNSYDLYYTNIEKEFIEAIKLTKRFRKIADELIDNGYKYEFTSHVSYSGSRAEWIINLIIK